MRFTPARAALAACLLLISTATLGADEPSLSLPEAIERARSGRPELTGFVFELQAQDARVRAAALRPAPQLEVLVEDALGSGARSALDAAQTTLSLGQLFELGGKREERGAVAQAQHARLRTEQAGRQLDVVAGIAQAFVAALAQQERIAAAGDALALADRVEQAVAARARAAASPPAERARAAVAAAEARLALDEARHVFDTARFTLASTIGLDRPDFERVAGPLFLQEPAPAFETLMARLEETPDFLRFTDEARLKEAELRLAQSQRRSDLRATLGVRRFEQDDDAALVGGIALPLFSAARAEPDIAVARAERDRIDGQRRAALLKARAQLFAHHQQMEHARHIVDALTGEVLPQLEQALTQIEDAWQRGRYSWLEWSDAQRRLLDARTRRIDAAAEFQYHRIEIERLTGETLVEAGDHS